MVRVAPGPSNHTELIEFCRVVSLILCHDKAKNRAKQIERLVEIAERLRLMNNYSACRAFVAGINHTTFDGDLTMEIFSRRSTDRHNTFKKYDMLFKNQRAHASYRTSIRENTDSSIPVVCVRSHCDASVSPLADD